MDVATNGTCSVHHETEGVGPPLVLVHGLTETLETWRDAGYVDALAPSTQVILLDVRCHGRSSKPHDPAHYATEALAGDVTAVLDDLGLASAHLYGYSNGGRIAFCLAKHAPARLR